MTVQDKEYLDNLHKKYYGPGSKAAKKKQKDEKVDIRIKKEITKKVTKPAKEVAPAPVLDNAEEKTGSRADLMAQAQKAGIKYFRILTKIELMKVLDPTTIQQDIEGIVAEAKARWQTGWGSRKAVGQVVTHNAPQQA